MTETSGKKSSKVGEAVKGIRAKLAAVFGKADAVLQKMEKRPVLFTVAVALLTCLVVEMLSRRSVIQGFVYIAQEPLLFLYNTLIILATLSLAWLFRRKRFALAVLLMCWLGLGITNCVLLGFRTTPLNFMDFQTFKDVMSIVTVYFTPFQIVMIGAAVIALLALLVFLFIKAPKEKNNRLKALAATAGLAAVLFATTTLGISTGFLATTFHNIHDAYRQYGFAYCFACSVVDRGISEPSDYSEASVQKILDRITEKQEAAGVSAEVVPSDHATKKKPNVIILQMESFFDVNHLKKVTFSENPLPVFTSMKENYSSGYLLTPSFGAGTSNTEFEVLTGMSMDFFGPGEYPYVTVMREKASESVAYDLKEYGYATHAIHDHTGKFYGRYLVYPHLGFDSFTSVEYMQDIERNPLNWVDDSCLTGEITKAMESTPEQDFVFAVSVQGHGKYPSECIDETQTITAQGFNEDEAVGFDYYVNQIHRMDEFLGELTDALSKSDEPTVLVVYGDHLPKFNISRRDLENGNQYQTEYVIWDNFKMKQQDKDLTCYQLYPEVLNRLNMHNGVINAFQQTCTEEATYFEDLKTLQYDMLYGKAYAFGGESPYKKTKMQMGIDPITISRIRKMGNYIYLEGENFTYASKIFVNDDELKTTFVNSGLILSEYEDLKEGDRIEVIQMSSRKTHLSSTGAYFWYETGIVPAEEDPEVYGMNLALTGKQSEEEVEEDIKMEEDEI